MDRGASHEWPMQGAPREYALQIVDALVAHPMSESPATPQNKAVNEHVKAGNSI